MRFIFKTSKNGKFYSNFISDIPENPTIPTFVPATLHPLLIAFLRSSVRICENGFDPISLK